MVFGASVWAHSASFFQSLCFITTRTTGSSLEAPLACKTTLTFPPDSNRQWNTCAGFLSSPTPKLMTPVKGVKPGWVEESAVCSSLDTERFGVGMVLVHNFEEVAHFVPPVLRDGEETVEEFVVRRIRATDVVPK